MPAEAIDYDSKMAQLNEKRMIEQQQRMADEALRHREAGLCRPTRSWQS